MANVNDRTDQGQIIIITALVIAILFVGLALVLNSVIYTENLSTRETGEQSSAVLQERYTVEHDMQLQVNRANDQILNGETDFPGASTSFKNSVSAYGDSRSNDLALTGRILVVQRVDQTEGTQIRQGTDGNFTAGGEIESDPDWKLANNITEAGNFELEVQREDLLDLSDDLASDGNVEHLLDAAFYVEVSSDSDEWRIFVFQESSGDISVITEQGERPDIEDRLLNSSIDSKCTVNADRAQIDLTEATLAGETCDQLDFYRSDVVGDEHDIEYKNARTDLAETGLDTEFPDLLLTNPTEGDRVTGTYDIVVDRPVYNLDYDPFHEAGVGEPTSQSVLYDISIRLLYRNTGAELVVEDREIEWSKVK